MRFSQRMGLAPVKTELEREGMSEELRNGLWSTVFEYMISGLNNLAHYGGALTIRAEFFKMLWVDFLKRPVDDLVIFTDGTVSEDSPLRFLRSWFFAAKWDEVYEFVEFCAGFRDDFIQPANRILKREMSAYRFIGNLLVPVNSEEEVVEVETANQNLDLTSPARKHLRQAMVLFSDRANPDYRNSIKESISAVESLVKILLGDDKASFGQAMKKLEEDHGLHPAMKKAFGQLYGYTSDSGGIRHAIKDGDVPVEAAEARFMLVTCSAFVNYLITKLN